jgi:hypothetical protein
MFQSVKDTFKEFLTLEKQYLILILLFILIQVRNFSGDAFEKVLRTINKLIVNMLSDKVNSLLYLFDGDFMYAFTKVLVYISGISFFSFTIVFLTQILILEKLLKFHISMNAIQYTADTFIGKFAISSTNFYIFVYLFSKVFGLSTDIKMYVPDNDFVSMGFWMSLFLSGSILLGVFIHGISKERTKAEVK